MQITINYVATSPITIEIVQGGGGGLSTTATDVEITDFTKGLILRTSDGSRIRVTALKDGDGNISLTTTVI